MCLGLTVTVTVHHTWYELGKNKFQLCTALSLWIAFYCILNSGSEKYLYSWWRTVGIRHSGLVPQLKEPGSFFLLVPLCLAVAFVSKDKDVVSVLLARERGKIKAGNQLRLSSSRSFPRNATGVIWDKHHGQPRSWTGPCASLSMRWGQGSGSKDERVKGGMLR